MAEESETKVDKRTFLEVVRFDLLNYIYFFTPLVIAHNVAWYCSKPLPSLNIICKLLFQGSQTLAYGGQSRTLGIAMASFSRFGQFIQCG